MKVSLPQANCNQLMSLLNKITSFKVKVLQSVKVCLKIPAFTKNPAAQVGNTLMQRRTTKVSKPVTYLNVITTLRFKYFVLQALLYFNKFELFELAHSLIGSVEVLYNANTIERLAIKRFLYKTPLAITYSSNHIDKVTKTDIVHGFYGILTIETLVKWREIQKYIAYVFTVDLEPRIFNLPLSIENRFVVQANPSMAMKNHENLKLGHILFP